MSTIPRKTNGSPNKNDPAEEYLPELDTRRRDKETGVQRCRDSEIQRNGDSDGSDDEEECRLFHRATTVQEAAQTALSCKGPGNPEFHFARALKAFERTTGAKLPRQELQSAFNVWWSLAKPKLPEDTDYDESRLLFLEAWEKVKTPLGSNVLETAVERLSSSPEPPEASWYGSAKLRRLVHLCHELQFICGDNPFFLSVRDAARVIGCKRGADAGVFLNGLVRDGVLKLVEKGTPGRRRASRFRYVRQPNAIISGG